MLFTQAFKQLKEEKEQFPVLTILPVIERLVTQAFNVLEEANETFAVFTRSPDMTPPLFRLK
jgi:hypothetical protein